MNKTEALARLTELEDQAKQLRAVIEAPDVLPSLLTKPVPGSGDRYWVLVEAFGGSVEFGDRCATSTNMAFYNHGNVFQTEAIAQAYAAAITTLLKLRHQPGTVPASDTKQVYICLRDTGLGVSTTVLKNAKMGRIAPTFATEQAALDAIKAVGEANVLAMFNALHGVYA